MALLGMIGFTALMFEGLKRTSASDAGIITATLPAVVALVGLAAMRERLRMSQAAAIGLAVAGLVLVAIGAERGAASLLGNLPHGWCGRLRGKLRHPRQTLGAALSAAAAGPRRQRGRIGRCRSAGVARDALRPCCGVAAHL